jgi:hypothetical protein
MFIGNRVVRGGSRMGSKVMTAAICAVLLMASGCASFGSLTPSPGIDASKGVWVAKKTSFLGLTLSDEEVLYCTGTPPACSKAHGDVGPAKTGSLK